VSKRPINHSVVIWKLSFASQLSRCYRSTSSWSLKLNDETWLWVAGDVALRQSPCLTCTRPWIPSPAPKQSKTKNFSLASCWKPQTDSGVEVAAWSHLILINHDKRAVITTGKIAEKFKGNYGFFGGAVMWVLRADLLVLGTPRWHIRKAWSLSNKEIQQSPPPLLPSLCPRLCPRLCNRLSKLSPKIQTEPSKTYSILCRFQSKWFPISLQIRGPSSLEKEFSLFRYCH
jgi:hypothetical protein